MWQLYRVKQVQLVRLRALFSVASHFDVKLISDHIAQSMRGWTPPKCAQRQDYVHWTWYHSEIKVQIVYCQDQRWTKATECYYRQSDAVTLLWIMNEDDTSGAIWSIRACTAAPTFAVHARQLQGVVADRKSSVPLPSSRRICIVAQFLCSHSRPSLLGRHIVSIVT